MVVCDNCGEEIDEGYEIRWKGKIYCSHHCVKKGVRNKAREKKKYQKEKSCLPPIKICEWCGKKMFLEEHIYDLKGGNWKTRKYCGSVCRKEANTERKRKQEEKWKIHQKEKES